MKIEIDNCAYLKIRMLALQKAAGYHTFFKKSVSLIKVKIMQTRISLRDVAIEAIKQLPESASVEEMMYQLDLVANVVEGLKDVEAGRT